MRRCPCRALTASGCAHCAPGCARGLRRCSTTCSLHHLQELLEVEPATLEAVVQSVHNSDIHLVCQMQSEQRHAGSLLLQHRPRRLRQGLAWADRPALRAFSQIVNRQLLADAAWVGLPIWLVGNGDGTTFGNAESLKEWMQWSHSFGHAAGPTTQQLQLCGNHGAWLDAFPLLEPGRMAEHRGKPRQHWFRESMPEPVLSVAIPQRGRYRVGIYTANTMDDRPVQKALARGVAASDFWWDPKPPMPGPTPAHDIERSKPQPMTTSCTARSAPARQVAS